jgi:Tol biopolymer transport system component
MAATLVVIALVAVGVARQGGGQQPGSPGGSDRSGATDPSGEPFFSPTSPVGPPITTAPWVTAERSEVDFVLDLDTGETTRLPGTILRALAPDPPGGRYAASPDGSTLAFVGLDGDGSQQIFLADLDGTDVRQVTHDPGGATSPAWSPDGTRIVYEGHADGDVSLFLLEVTTGEATKVTDVPIGGGSPTFTPDGTSLVYTGGSDQVPVLMTVPLAGGESSILVEPSEGIDDSGNGSLSPDGSLVTFLGSGAPESGDVEHCGPCRFLANADGSNKQVIWGWMATPAGMWSPDGSRIVVLEQPESILVVDVSTEATTHVANGKSAIWLDDHTLLVQV